MAELKGRELMERVERAAAELKRPRQTVVLYDSSASDQKAEPEFETFRMANMILKVRRGT